MTTPTHDIDDAAPRISGVAELAARLEGGGKPRSKWRIGTEHEKFGFLVGSNKPLPYEGDASIRVLMETLQSQHGWSPILEGETLIGLKREGASISLEPGGQFELSGAPLENIHETCSEISNHLQETLTIADKLGAGFLTLGASPVWSLAETPRMPKGRYGIMERYMQRVGRLGREMMFRTCTVQTNLDYADEADMVKKLRVSLALQPVATALFANSPFLEGRPNGYLSYRSHIWTDTDPDRSGMLPFAFEDGFGFERYVDFALDVPMYFVRRGGKYIDVAGQSFRDFMKGKLPGLPGELPAMDDFDDHLSTIFPEVRLKTFLEMRGADAGPQSRLCALSAFWVGLLYDSGALDEAWQLVKTWTWQQREAARRSVPALGLQTPVADRLLRDVARDALAISRKGLKARACKNSLGDDETQFLADLDLTIETGKTLADTLLDQYRGPWKRDINRVFSEHRFSL
jgi:glutamate--cysteine ligase